MEDKLNDFIKYIKERGEWLIKEEFNKKWREILPQTIVLEILKIQNLYVQYEDSFYLEKSDARLSPFCDYFYKVKANVICIYKSRFGEHKSEIIEFWLYSKIFFQNEQISIEVLDPRKMILRKNLDLKLDIIEELKLQKITIDTETSYFTPNILSKFFEIVRSKKENRKYKDFEVLTDLTFSHQDFLFLLAEMQLFKPYVQDYLENFTYANNKKHYVYHHTMFDKMYLFLGSQAIQNEYIFWDKIANILNSHFKIVIINGKVFFPVIIQGLLPDILNDDDVNWLREFYNTRYKRLNKLRISAVHKIGIESKFTYGAMMSSGNEQEMKKLQDDKMKFIEELTNYAKDNFEGFECVIKIIEKFGK